jgi:hypothetical protein
MFVLDLSWNDATLSRVNFHTCLATNSNRFLAFPLLKLFLFSIDKDLLSPQKNHKTIKIQLIFELVQAFKVTTLFADTKNSPHKNNKIYNPNLISCFRPLITFIFFMKKNSSNPFTAPREKIFSSLYLYLSV